MNDCPDSPGSPADGVLPLSQDAPREACPSDFDLVFEHWLSIGCLAWSGAITTGPGFVGLTVYEDGVGIEYRPGSPCDCHPVTADTYDPSEQVVVVVRRRREASTPMVLWGWPSPPECYAGVSAELSGETVH